MSGLSPNRTHYFGLLLASLFAVLLLSLASVNAASTGNGAGFTVRAEIPDNQIDKSVSYFDLKVHPSLEQRLTLIVANTSSQARTLSVIPTNAWTGDNGQISYSPNKKRQPAGHNTFTDLVSAGANVALQPHEAKPVTFVLKTPAKQLKGQIVGAFYVTDKHAQQLSSGKNFRINNHYAMTLGVNLQETDSLTLAPDLKLNQIKTSTNHYQSQVTASVANTQPVMFGEMTVTGQVYRRGNSHLLYETTKKHYEMAPLTSFNFGVPVTKHRLKPGHYTFKLTAKSGKHIWHLSRHFTVTRQTARQVNRHMNIHHNWTWLYILLSVLGALILIIVGYLMGSRRHPKK
ncbi:MAG: DUF916 and DUF3324 domain-containing protein [Furfurilactobacillus sp.]|jgi:hypothetical protein|uniref:DUF916 and DUF3324 domain-containing protein n=1 Tax=Furfurilactobacillus milii TaxID=2888272 RepID=A0ABT6D8Y5_9LACO|nr:MULTISPECIES: DUF916 and DUF3324 domain-containing protein [Furfurilactobacillus]QLE67244.1 cell surface protein precursor [Furfurilactobacillus rossiae]MCF6161065.1 DUF916 and DUF3324 domain-containing protein [Furfurilactobacillus milii]MCF6163445.1 DUF916 and DUF3324 domain-containing protein [Furfurilactobacillus milii]MCF6418753.1 DUF916 and DUF3324 domain-containing protein [Furfurilactobacillus milii]MCH4011435.1 DUF916 and DUF3324 domain-containing protein [Furfurilactobacillus sp.]